MNNNGVPYINGQLYDWGNIAIGIAGVTLTGIRAVRYADRQETTAVFAGGRYATGFGKGRITCEASLTLLMEEIVALQNASPNGRLQDIAPFDITVTYMHPVSSKIVTDVIKQCQFMDNSRDWTEGDTSEEVELTLLTPKIDWGETEV